MEVKLKSVDLSEGKATYCISAKDNRWNKEDFVLTAEELDAFITQFRKARAIISAVEVARNLEIPEATDQMVLVDKKEIEKGLKNILVGGDDKTPPIQDEVPF